MVAAAAASWNFILYSHDFISLRSPFPLSAPFSGLKDLLYAIISVEIENSAVPFIETRAQTTARAIHIAIE
jgi:hypothetical protein